MAPNFSPPSSPRISVSMRMRTSCKLPYFASWVSSGWLSGCIFLRIAIATRIRPRTPKPAPAAATSRLSPLVRNPEASSMNGRNAPLRLGLSVSHSPNLKGAFLPFMLDASGFRPKGDNLLVAAAGAGFGVLGLILVAIAIRRKMQPESHPLLTQLAKYGSLQDVRMRIDTEMRGEDGGEKFGAMQITTNWLIHSPAYKTNVMATRDVVWAYPKVTKHYHSGIPTGKTYSAIIRDSKGQSVEISGKKDSVPKMLESLQRRMPWVVIGFSKELEALWLNEKPKFNQLVEQRRANLAGATR